MKSNKRSYFFNMIILYTLVLLIIQADTKNWKIPILMILGILFLSSSD